VKDKVKQAFSMMEQALKIMKESQEF